MTKLPKPRISTELLRAIIQGIELGVLLALAFAGGFLYRDRLVQAPRSPVSFALINEADAVLAQNYLFDMPDETVRVRGAVKGLVASLNDPYTFYVEPQTAKVDATSLAGKFGGIGIEVGRGQNGEFVVTRVYRDNPAEKAGMQEGDIILAVDSQPVDNKATNDDALLAAIRGDVGTPVSLTLMRQDKTLDVTIIRVEVQIPSTFWKLVETDQRIGYIQIVRFTQRTPDEVKTAISELSARGATAYILDLRGNGGGLVDSAVGVASQFLRGGPVLYEHSRTQGDRIFNASTDGLAHEAPLIVLVDANTASAAEILGGALQDRDRAKLVGQKTYGKGSVQVILSLSDGSSIHVTYAEWLTPARHPLQGQGLTPDTTTTPVTGKDVDLDTAVAQLQALLGVPK